MQALCGICRTVTTSVTLVSLQLPGRDVTSVLMNYRILGRTGFKVSEIGFGAWAIGGGWGQQNDADSLAALHGDVESGLNFIDTAAGYGNGKSERLIAQALKEHSGHIYVATKTPALPNGPWPPSPYCLADVRYPEQYCARVSRSVCNLNTDCLDVLQLHTWTRAWNRDPKPFAILPKLQQEGKIRRHRRLYSRERPELRYRSDAARLGGCGAGNLQYFRAGTGRRTAASGPGVQCRHHRARGI